MLAPLGSGLVEHVERSVHDRDADVVTQLAEGRDVGGGGGGTGVPSHAELRGLGRGRFGLGGRDLRLTLLLLDRRGLARRGRGVRGRPRPPDETADDDGRDRADDDEHPVLVEPVPEARLPGHGERVIIGDLGLLGERGLRGLGGLRVTHTEEVVERHGGVGGLHGDDGGERGDGVGRGGLGGRGALALALVLSALLVLRLVRRRLLRGLLVRPRLRVGGEAAGTAPLDDLVLALRTAGEGVETGVGRILRAHGNLQKKLLTRSRADAPEIVESTARTRRVPNRNCSPFSGILELRPSGKSSSDGEFGLLTGKFYYLPTARTHGKSFKHSKAYSRNSGENRRNTCFQYFSNSFQQAKIPTFGTSE